jgi:voltage-gated potassium channel
MSATAPAIKHGNAYNLFILVMTVLSLVIMVLLLLPFNAETIALLRVYDNVVCGIFLADFVVSLIRAPSKRGYFVRERGWLDLLGSIPSVAGLEAVGLLRLARLSRFARIARILRNQDERQLVRDALRNRAQYAGTVTVLCALIVIGSASLVTLQAESSAAGSNIRSSGDALWWAIVTITTVGYGDRYPITGVGRGAALFVMAMGVGLIASFASLMSTFLILPQPLEQAEQPAGVEQKLAGLEAEVRFARAELAELRQLLQRPQDQAGAEGAAPVGEARHRPPPPAYPSRFQ